MNFGIEMVLFEAVWYCVIISVIVREGFQLYLLIFLLGGLIPVLAMLQSVRKALFCRACRKEAIALGKYQNGRIVGVSRKAVPVEVRNGRQRYKTYYFLQVELVNPENGAVSQFISPAYSKPIHKYLSGPNVRVYTDKSGWKRYLEDFSWKERMSDPDLFDTPKEYNASGWLARLTRLIFIAVLVLMLLEVLHII